ncbi:MAG: hypothetical protein QOD99_2377 [Chthoniobacter sp.]|jgi:DNA-binding response OmpR family regulator|nr:hypothetical protein [Chthoniobacter sp.]
MEPAAKRIQLPENYSGVTTKKILLLEDDAQFSEVLKIFLESHFFEVVCVRNGADGVREVMASDFELVICDMMMPKLPGDMFYRAVQRLRPHLCPRFIFITGMRGNPRVNDFIKQVNGTILCKPFHVDDLLEVMGFVQVRCSLHQL